MNNFTETIARLKADGTEFSVFSNHAGRIEVRTKRVGGFESNYFNEDTGDWLKTEQW